MADLKTHCRDCVQELGEEFRQVHEWLDELFKYTGSDHREYRHNFPRFWLKSLFPISISPPSDQYPLHTS